MKDLTVGTLLPPFLIGPLTAEKTRAYAVVSGDDNPLHLDETVALKAGLPRPAVHGMQLVAFMHEIVRRWQPEFTVATFSTRFLAPVLTGETVEITGRIVEAKEDGGVLRLFLRGSGGSLAVLGEAKLKRTLSA